MELVEAIRSRRSVRKYEGKPVPEELLEQIVDLARHSPTASNAQAWKFIIVQNLARIRKISMFSPGMLGRPPSLIVVAMDTVRVQQRSGRQAVKRTMLFDAGIASYCISLAALDKGLGSCIIGSFNQLAIGSILGFPEHVKPLLMVAIGYCPEDKKPEAPKSLSLQDVIFHEEFK